MSTSQKGAFDSEQWKAQKGSGARNNPRVGMVVDLQRKHTLEGMSRDDVRKLLGEPDRQHGTSEVYELGASPFGPSYESFVIDYDAGGKVTQARLNRS
ncbi:hypothetical protein [Pyxidicoccus xibeiensis]|uniref:hypothetical protein n=1 Tax=Pyxidicoccus xibeiensis TaxID=2906759 RepID=UPI0020A72280|nr:hypothetical protein [Pyxidicoccus xibeiensis]MCP3142458.1 hypothetical protein [Pyxidicoccus xibeiensis]